MGKILNIIQDYSGGKCYQSERFSLDYYHSLEYQDKDEVFSNDKIFETDNNGKNVALNINASVSSLFKYFLDGSRKVYKIVDFGTTDGKFLPILAGQVGSAVCYRQNKNMKLYKLARKNILAVPDRMGDDFEEMRDAICKLQVFPKNRSLVISDILKYDAKPTERSYEDLGTAKIQVAMMNMEIELVREMVSSNKLKTDQMLIIDGSLQFSGVEDEDTIFQNVIGISKSFNPNLQGMLKSKKQIGEYLTNLKFGERTPVFSYESNSKRKRKNKIGAWYLRIRQKENMKKPLDGVIKIEKIATKRVEKEDGFDTDTINEISRSILLERNVTCYGNDNRWANHLYPIYLTELLLKNSFASNTVFLNIF